MILQIATLRDDTFWHVEESLLRSCLEVPGLGEREKLLRSGLTPAQVHSEAESDVILVLNGHEDAESWEELAEELG